MSISEKEFCEKKLHTPDGFMDYLPKSNYLKELTQENIQEVFKRYGYKSIASPTLEFIEVFQNKSSVSRNQVYQFMDKSGDILALRADVTPSIVRIASRNYSEVDLPIRFSYIQNIFKDSKSNTGKLKEVTQAGVELIGVSSAESDAEVIAVSINSLLLAGITEFQIDIGHVDFVSAFLEEVNENVREDIHKLLVKKDFATAGDFARRNGVKTEIVKTIEYLPLLSGGKEVLERVRKDLNETDKYLKTTQDKVIKVVDYLQKIYEIIEEYGLSQYIVFDLSIAGDVDYYTGIIFKGYTKGLGFSILDGGRYDSLACEFGKNFPSVGFAIKINNVVNALENKNTEVDYRTVDTLVAYSNKGRKEALATADELRSQGLIVENSFILGDIDKNLEYARLKNIAGIIYFAENITLINVETDDRCETTIEQLLQTK